MHTCPVCGYPELEEPPRSPSGGGSYEICPSCGFQFGVDDDDKGITYDEWRVRWKEKGQAWSSRGNVAPRGWNANSQLATLGKPSPPPKQARTSASASGKKKAKPVKLKKPVPKAKQAMPAKKSGRKKR
jgi:hypothetical protein